MIEIFFAFVVGAMAGYWAKPKDPQIDLYNRNYEKYEKEIKYYKELCQWHVEQRKNHE